MFGWLFALGVCFYYLTKLVFFWVRRQCGLGPRGGWRRSIRRLRRQPFRQSGGSDRSDFGRRASPGSGARLLGWWWAQRCAPSRGRDRKPARKRSRTREPRQTHTEESWLDYQWILRRSMIWWEYKLGNMRHSWLDSSAKWMVPSKLPNVSTTERRQQLCLSRE